LKLYFLAFLLSLLLPTFANGEKAITKGKEEITGAFGFNFGEALKESDILEVRKYHPSAIVVKARKPHPLFDFYRVGIDLKTKGVTEIFAYKRFNEKTNKFGKEPCQKDKTYLEKILRNKYSGIFSDEALIGIPDNRNIAFEISNGDRWIRVICSKNGPPSFPARIEIMYADNYLGKLASERQEQERFLERKKQLGQDGL
jgi:hypothetical protein